MRVTVYPSAISGIVTAAASKSSMQRALAASLLHKGKAILHNPGKSNDDLASIEIVEALGALVAAENNTMEITSEGVEPVVTGINCRESGLAIRMFTPIIALCDKKITIKGEGSLKKRPMDFFDEVLPQLGVSFKSTDGKLPMIIQGPVRPADIEIDGSLSSQFLTGLLMAYSAAAAKNVTIKVNDLKSKPYVDLTLEVMKRFGMKVPENRKYEEFYFPATDISHHADTYPVKTIDYFVEGDWSGAAFLLVAGVIAGSVTVKGLDINSSQADKTLLNALKDCGALVSINNEGIVTGTPREGSSLAFHFDATDCPDLFPPLVALASYCKGTTTIRGVGRLQHKESNRSLSLQQEFGRMGVEIRINGDEMLIEGGNELKGTTVHSHHDHRIAMACAVAALKATGETVIEEADAVNKSYPDFYQHLKMLGATVSLPANQ